MDFIKTLHKLENENYLNRDHKIILYLLYEQFISPRVSNTLTPTQIEKFGLYGVRKIHNTLKELVDMGFVDNSKGNYQITPKYQHLVGKITYKEMLDDNGVYDITGYTQSKIEEFLRELPIISSYKEDLLKDLKITSNQNKTIFHHFKNWFDENEAHQYFNQFQQYKEN